MKELQGSLVAIPGCQFIVEDRKLLRAPARSIDALVMRQLKID